MNNYICIGKIVNTHGIKGELRILSDFELKKEVFKENQVIYIGPEKIEETINSYRHHKVFEMITLKNYNDINEVLKYKNNYVYIKRDNILNDNEYVLEDLINMKVIDNNKELGIIKDYYNNNGNILLEVQGIKVFYIPINSNYIKKVDLNNKEVITENAKDLIL